MVSSGAATNAQAAKSSGFSVMIPQGVTEPASVPATSAMSGHEASVAAPESLQFTVLLMASMHASTSPLLGERSVFSRP